MKYYGRIICILIVIISTLFWMMYYYYEEQIWNWNELWYNLPILAFSWYMGKKYDESKFLSEYDYLTRVKNRRYIYKKFPKILKRWQRQDKNVCVFLLDINNFKVANDENGHQAGDYLLKEVSNVIRVVTRKTDIVARWGGDEFLIITPFLSEEDAHTLTKRLKEAILEEESLKEFGVSLSIGFSYYPKHGKELDELIHHADLLMYQDKEQQKGDRLKEEERLQEQESLLYAKHYQVEERLKHVYTVNRKKGDSVQEAIHQAIHTVQKEVLSEVKVLAEEKEVFHIYKLVTELENLSEHQDQLIREFESDSNQDSYAKSGEVHLFH